MKGASNLHGHAGCAIFFQEGSHRLLGDHSPETRGNCSMPTGITDEDMVAQHKIKFITNLARRLPTREALSSMKAMAYQPTYRRDIQWRIDHDSVQFAVAESMPKPMSDNLFRRPPFLLRCSLFFESRNTHRLLRLPVHPIGPPYRQNEQHACSFFIQVTNNLFRR